LRKSRLTGEMGQLHFCSVRDASASSPVDYERILDAIQGQVEHIDGTIQLLRNVGYFNRNVQTNWERGMDLEMAQYGLNPFMVPLCVVTWEFWWVADLAARKLYVEAWCLPLGSIAFFLVVLHTVQEHIIFPKDIALKLGIIFLVISRPLCVNEEAIVSMSMWRSTLPLQLVLLLLLVVVSALFFSKKYVPQFARFLAFTHGLNKALQNATDLQKQQIQAASLVAENAELEDEEDEDVG